MTRQPLIATFAIVMMASTPDHAAGPTPAAHPPAAAAAGATLERHPQELSAPGGDGGAADVSDLELSEVPASAGAHDTMVVFLTGDGGWADLDQAVAHGLAARGVPTVGWSSLRYYWVPRTPDTAAADLARIIRHYMAAWDVRQVSLVGYSFGADVLPFLVTRLPADLAARVSRVALLGLSDTASFEFHVANWVGIQGPGYPTQPELQRVQPPVTCIYGAGDGDTICPHLGASGVRVVKVGRQHHFSNDYAGLVAAILGGRMPA